MYTTHSEEYPDWLELQVGSHLSSKASDVGIVYGAAIPTGSTFPSTLFGQHVDRNSYDSALRGGSSDGSTQLNPVTRFRFIFDALPSVSEDCADSSGTAVDPKEEGTCLDTAGAAAMATWEEMKGTFMRAEEVVLPVKVPLWSLTVADLAAEFSARVNRKYPLLGTQWTVSTFLMRHPVMEEEMQVDLPPIQPKLSALRQRAVDRRLKAMNAAASVPSSSAKAQESEGQFWSLDVCMNGEDTLDDFFQAPANVHEVRVYDLIVRWELKEVCGTRIPNLTTNMPNDVNSGCIAASKRSSGHCKAAAVAAAVAPPEPVVMVVQRSTYLDLLQRKCARAAEIAARTYVPPPFPFLDAQDSQGMDSAESSTTSSLDALIAPSREQLERRRRRQERAAAVHELLGDEGTARAAITEEERRGAEMLKAMEADALRHVLTLEALKGDFTKNGQLAAFLRRRRFYPLDTVPLTRRRSPELTERLTQSADCAVQQSFAFKGPHRPRKNKKQQQKASDDPLFLLRSPIARKGKGRGGKNAQCEHNSDDDDTPPVQFRQVLQDAIDAERVLMRKEEEEELRVAYYVMRGEPVPPRTPTPPPTPRTPTMEDIPEYMYKTVLEAYLEDRRDIIRTERVLFRDITRTMTEVLVYQRTVEEEAVRQAFLEELDAARALDFAAYLPYGHTGLGREDNETQVRPLGVGAPSPNEDIVLMSEGAAVNAQTYTSMQMPIYASTESWRYSFKTTRSQIQEETSNAMFAEIGMLAKAGGMSIEGRLRRQYAMISERKAALASKERQTAEKSKTDKVKGGTLEDIKAALQVLMRREELTRMAIVEEEWNHYLRMTLTNR